VKRAARVDLALQFADLGWPGPKKMGATVKVSAHCFLGSSRLAVA
jgi:hypothetical protein